MQEGGEEHQLAKDRFLCFVPQPGQGECDSPFSQLSTGLFLFFKPAIFIIIISDSYTSTEDRHCLYEMENWSFPHYFKSFVTNALHCHQSKALSPATNPFTTRLKPTSSFHLPSLRKPKAQPSKGPTNDGFQAGSGSRRVLYGFTTRGTLLNGNNQNEREECGKRGALAWDALRVEMWFPAPPREQVVEDADLTEPQALTRAGCIRPSEREESRGGNVGGSTGKSGPDLPCSAHTIHIQGVNRGRYIF